MEGRRPGIAAVAAFASTALAWDNDNDGDDLKFDLVPSLGLPAAALKGPWWMERTPAHQAPLLSTAEGDAGVQVLNSGGYPDLAGPLIKVTTSGN